MRILIATGIYPPKAGGPAKYAFNLKKEFEALGHTVFVSTYTIEERLPTGMRHVWYFFKTLPAYLTAEYVIVLDTYSVGFPIAFLKMMFGGTVVLRTGGDFLWEAYIERTRHKICLSDFYNSEKKLTLKERIIFLLTKWVLHMVSIVVFSSEYQRSIWLKSYNLSIEKTSIIENQYAFPAQVSSEVSSRTFITICRPLVLKNIDLLQEAFIEAQKTDPGIELEVDYNVRPEEVIERLKNSYAVIVVSVSEISPNLVLEALSLGKPVIVTKENGLLNRIGSAVITVNPLSREEIKDAILSLSDSATYVHYKRAVESLTFTHLYKDIAQEFLNIYKSYKKH